MLKQKVAALELAVKKGVFDWLVDLQNKREMKELLPLLKMKKNKYD